MKSVGMRIVLLSLVIATSLANAARAADTQLWSEVDLLASPSSGIRFTFPLVMRNSFDLANPQLGGAGCIVDFSVTKDLTVTAGYLFVGLPNTGKGYESNIPLAAITIRHKLGRLELSDRNRAEELFGLPNSPIRYRNKVSVDLPLASGRWIPFVTNEIFYDFSVSKWTQDRLQLGLGMRLNPHVKLNTFFLLRSDLQAKANDVHALGLMLEWSLTGKKAKGAEHGEN
jgi:hypothetical protein